MRILILLAVVSGSLFAQSIRPIPWKDSPIRGSAVVRGQSFTERAKAVEGRSAYFFIEDVVFPHLATGDGWETEMALVNMGKASQTFGLFFYTQQGTAMQVTLREMPSGEEFTDSAFEVSLDSGASTTVVMLDTTPGQLRQGWAVVDYTGNSNRIGGHATFRQKIAGRADYEALIPMSSYKDFAFMLPVNDSAGFITAMAMCNPSANVASSVLLQLLDVDGIEVARREITLNPQQHVAAAVRDWFPQVQGNYATLYVESSTDRLSAVGLRFNTAGGNSFSSVPVLNWEGLLPDQ
jgi:hypothetical protein